jgi:hypothetical protein
MIGDVYYFFVPFEVAVDELDPLDGNLQNHLQQKCALCFTLAMSWGHLALSQAPSQKEIQTFYQNRGINAPLKASGEIGHLVYAPVKLDGCSSS